jgi:hypothetical protein
MPYYRPIRNEKGVVLVAALLIVALLMLMAMTLSYTMSSYLKMVGSVRAKSQDYYSSLGGVDRTRTFLGSNLVGANFNIWGGLLSLGTGSYRDVTQVVTGSTATAFVPGASGSSYRIFVKDNDDGDGDFASDNDQIVIASVVAKNDVKQTTSTIEAMLIFDQSVLDDYAQGGGGVNKANRAKSAGSDVTTTRQIDQ